MPEERSTVITVTPVAKLPKTRRNSSGLDADVIMANFFEDITPAKPLAKVTENSRLEKRAREESKALFLCLIYGVSDVSVRPAWTFWQAARNAHARIPVSVAGLVPAAHASVRAASTFAAAAPGFVSAFVRWHFAVAAFVAADTAAARASVVPDPAFAGAVRSAADAFVPIAGLQPPWAWRSVVDSPPPGGSVLCWGLRSDFVA